MEIDLSFMTTTGTAPYYSWPLIEDLFWEPQSVIVRMLDEPEERRIPTNNNNNNNNNFLFTWLSCRQRTYIQA